MEQSDKAHVRTPQTSLGQLQQIDDRTVLVTGQDLDLEAKQPDVANAVVHRTGNTVVVVDTGVTAAFRTALRSAIEALGGAAQRILLLTTHGHTDHVGNNDLVDQIAAERNIPVEHFVPAADLEQLLDPVSYWTRAFTNIVDLAPLPAPPDLSAAFIVSLFQPLNPFGTTTRTYEQLPMQELHLGGLRINGWSFADGAVDVIRSQGHCAGHVIVHLRDSQLLHLGDEDNGPCATMADADQVKMQTTLALAKAMVDSGQIRTLTDGHQSPRHGADAQAFLDDLLQQAAGLQGSTATTLNDLSSIDARQHVDQLTQIFEAGTSGMTPNPVFTAMIAVNQLREAGLVRQPHSTTWRRPTLRNPKPVTGQPHGLDLIPAAAEMIGWKLHHHHRNAPMPPTTGPASSGTSATTREQA